MFLTFSIHFIQVFKVLKIWNELNFLDTIVKNNNRHNSQK